MSFPALSKSKSFRVENIVKPGCLRQGDHISVIAPASPAERSRVEAGVAELIRLGFSVVLGPERAPDGFFAAPHGPRGQDLLAAFRDKSARGLVGLRGGYGSGYLLDALDSVAAIPPKCLIGFSDLTTLQVYFWQRFGLISFYAPMIVGGFDAGAGNPRGYDETSFLRAVSETSSGWTIDLQGEVMAPGDAEGFLLGGCMTLIETTIGTPWQLHTAGGVLLLEDRGMKPWQVDRALLHFAQAGLFSGVRGILLGDFPECDPPTAGSWSVAEVCARLLRPLNIPIVWGAPVGHTSRPMLTVPLGVRARLRAEGAGTLEILEPAVSGERA